MGSVRESVHILLLACFTISSYLLQVDHSKSFPPAPPLRSPLQRPQGHPAKSKFLAMKIPINQIFILCVAASIPIHTCLADSPSAGATSTGGLNRDVRSALARTVEFFKKRAAEDEEGWILSQTSPSPTTASTQTETAGSVSTANTYTPSCVSAYRTQTKKA